jgi:glucose dehydrogenase
MFRGGPSHSGVVDTAVPEHLTVKWKFQTGDAIVSSPSVAGGRVYIGSNDNFLYALDAATGKLLWKFDCRGNVASSPAVVGGLVYVSSLDGNLYAVDAANGVKKWSFATEGERRFSAPGINYIPPAKEIMPEIWDFYLSSPTVVGDTVYFGSGDHQIYAVDAATGALRWKFATGNVVHASPAVAEGIVYIGSFDSYFYALSARDGTLLWKFKTGDDEQAHCLTGIPGSACVADGVVYFGSRDAHVYALDAKTGALRWNTATDGSWVVASPAVRNAQVYATTSDSKKFMVFDARTGAVLYTLPTAIYAFSSPVIVRDRAYFGTFDGRLHEVDLTTKTYRETFAVPGYEQNRSRYLKPDGELNGSVVWTGDTLEDVLVDMRTKLFSLGSILSTPAVRDGVVYFGSVDGSVYALGL